MGQRESDLVQSIADTMWRLKRIPCLENAIFAQGHMEFAEAFNHHDASLRAGMIEVQTFMKYEKQLRNLQLQESRLARRREKEMAELRQLQQERRCKERRERKRSKPRPGSTWRRRKPINPLIPSRMGSFFQPPKSSSTSPLFVPEICPVPVSKGAPNKPRKVTRNDYCWLAQSRRPCSASSAIASA